MIIFCLAGVILNIAFNKIFTAGGMWFLPLYLDTIFTVTVTLLGGIFWGALTGALTNIIGHSINFWGWEGYLFAICNITTAFITWGFIKIFPQELNLIRENSENQKSLILYGRISKIITLTLLSFTLCLAMSLLGGLISTFIQIISSPPADELQLKALLGSTMFPQMHIVFIEILSRIPVNIIDRLIAAFGGYYIAHAISLLGKKLNYPLQKKLKCD